jgi:putative membrane protein
MEKDTPLITRDYLAIERTKLANERTFLAYFRTAVIFMASGFSIMELQALQEIYWVGIALLSLSPVVFLIGIYRMLRVKKRIRRYAEDA